MESSSYHETRLRRVVRTYVAPLYHRCPYSVVKAIVLLGMFGSFYGAIGCLMWGQFVGILICVAIFALTVGFGLLHDYAIEAARDYAECRTASRFGISSDPNLSEDEFLRHVFTRLGELHAKEGPRTEAEAQLADLVACVYADDETFQSALEQAGLARDYH